MLLQNHLRPGHCPHCGAWLGRGRDRHALSLPSQDGSQVKKARLVGDVLALSELPRNLSGESVAFINLKNCIAAVTGGDYRSFSEICKVPVHVMWSLQKLVPKLDSLVTIAARLDVPLTRFFESEASLKTWNDAAARLDSLSRQIVLSHEEVRDRLREALAESPPPRLWAVAKRLGFKSSNPVRRIDSDLSTRIHRRFLESVRSGEQPYKQTIPISQKVDFRNTLRSELGKDRPNSLAEISRQLGCATPRQIRWRYPDLCDAISAKLKGLRARRLETEHDELNRILGEDVVPSLPEVSKGLGYKSLTMLMQNHAELCALIIARRKQQRVDALTEIAETVKELLKSPSLAVGEIFAVIEDQRRFFRQTFPELYRQVMAKEEEALHRKRAEEIEQAENTVKRVFDEIASSSTSVSNAEVMRRLPKGSYLWAKNVARIIRTIRAHASSN